jgi:hypothetical protein
MRNKRIFILPLLLLFFNECYSQYTFVSDSSHVYETATGSKFHSIYIKANPIPAATQTITVTDMLTGDASTLDYKFNSPTSLQFGPGFPPVQAVVVEILSDNKQEPSETINLNIAVPAGATVNLANHSINIYDVATNSLPAIRIAIGSNFDYLDKVELKNLYFGFETFAPKIFNDKILGKKGSTLLNGLHLGFSWSQNFSSDTIGYIPGPNQNLLNPGQLTPGLSRQDTPLKAISKDCTLVKFDYYTRKTTAKVNNFSFYVSTLSKLGNSDDGTLDVYFSIRLEGIRRSFRYDYSGYEKFFTDTVRVARPYGNIPSPDITKQLLRQQVYYDFYASIGMPIVWEPQNDLFELRFNPMIGIGRLDSPFHKGPYPDIESHNKFYLFQLSIIEKKFGIRLGGEVRGSFGGISPYYTLNLSKVFTFKKLEEYLKI